jgi:hypothetical protein
MRHGIPWLIGYLIGYSQNPNKGPSSSKSHIRFAQCTGWCGKEWSFVGMWLGGDTKPDYEEYTWDRTWFSTNLPLPLLRLAVWGSHRGMFLPAIIVCSDRWTVWGHTSLGLVVLLSIHVDWMGLNPKQVKIFHSELRRNLTCLGFKPTQSHSIHLDWEVTEQA